MHRDTPAGLHQVQVPGGQRRVSCNLARFEGTGSSERRTHVYFCKTPLPSLNAMTLAVFDEFHLGLVSVSAKLAGTPHPAVQRAS